MGYFPLGVRACARSRSLSRSKLTLLIAPFGPFRFKFQPFVRISMNSPPPSTARSHTRTPRFRPRSPAEAAAWPAVAAELVPPGPPGLLLQLSERGSCGPQICSTRRQKPKCGWCGTDRSVFNASRVAMIDSGSIRRLDGGGCVNKEAPGDRDWCNTSERALLTISTSDFALFPLI